MGNIFKNFLDVALKKLLVHEREIKIDVKLIEVKKVKKALISKFNLKHKNQFILFMITNGKNGIIYQ